MKKEKKMVLYIFVATFVLTICFGFGKIFAFNKGTEKDNTLEVTDELVNKLYNYLPKDNDYNVSSMYVSFYTTVQNVNYSIISKMAYENIVNNDSFKLETLTAAELNSQNIKGTPLYKIKKEVFMESVRTIFGKDAKEYTNDFTINATTNGTFKEDYVYIYTKPNELFTNEYVIYKDKLSFTVTDNNQTIKIYDYYLKCSKIDNICYNDERNTIKNNYVKYNANININNYKDKLQQYVHVFKYEDGNYYWFSSEKV